MSRQLASLTEDLLAEARQQVAALRQHGPRAKLSDSQAVLRQAYAFWLQQRSPEAEQLCQLASIAHGAVSAFAGDWREAQAAFNLVHHGWLPINAPLERKRLKALVLANSAIALFRSGEGDPEKIYGVTHSALTNLRAIPEAGLQQWEAPVLIVASLLSRRYNRYVDAHKHVVEATRRLNAAKQPELHILTQRLIGNGKGLVRDGMFHTRRATLQAAECLYYFNDQTE